MDKKAFSIIEILFSLALISIIVTVAVTKFDGSLQSSHKIQIKSDVLQIRAAILAYKNKLLLQNQFDSFESLEESGQRAFEKILKTPVQTTQNKAGSWSISGKNSYKVLVNSTQSVTFVFDKTDYSFDCDRNEPLCKELSL